LDKKIVIISTHMKFSMTGHEKMWPFNTVDCLIEAIAWAVLTVIILLSETDNFVLFNLFTYFPMHFECWQETI
jgi:hypothetical protein